MIIALVTALLLLSGGGTAGYFYDLAELEKSVKAEVADSSRKDKAVDVVENMLENDKDFREDLKDYIASLDKEVGDNVLSHQEVQTILEPLVEDLREYQQSMLDNRFALREQLERDEWAAIFPPE